jgi:hypothetical protein
MHKPIIQGSVAWQDLYDQGYVVVKKDEYMSHWPTQGWQPIETAPKDGENIIVSDGTYTNVGWWEFYNPEPSWGGYILEPTHWMKLPEPPK